MISEVNVNSFDELPALCLRAEQNANDGYAVLAQHDGKHVADAEHVYQRYSQSSSPGYDHACGYHD
jgi:hypothetical protein